MSWFAVWLSLVLASGAMGEAGVAYAEASVTEAEVDGRAQSAIDRWAKSAALDGTSVGVAVRCTADGRSWGGRAATTPKYTASVAKLLTTAAALETWTPTMRWKTQVRGNLGPDGRVKGDLVLVGHGDPQLMPDDIETLADAVMKAGVRYVEGDLVVNAGHFGAELLPPGYDIKTTDAAYRPNVSAIGSNYGAIAVSVRPGERVGDEVRVSVAPRTSAVKIKILATTAPGNGIAELQVEAQSMDDGRTRVIVRGRLGQKARMQRVRRRVTDPGLLTGALLGARLSKRGVTLRGRMRRATKLGDALPPVIVETASEPLGVLLRDMNTYSNNAMAETVFRQLGVGKGTGDAGSWAAAQRRVTEILAGIGIAESELAIVNGSGLYLATKASPGAVVGLLTHYAGEGVRPRAFRDSLAVSGKAGTLKGRLRSKQLRGKVRAKTGTLDEVVAIGGYVPAHSGCLLAFSVLVNDASAKQTKRLRKHVDALIVQLADL